MCERDGENNFRMFILKDKNARRKKSFNLNQKWKNGSLDRERKR